MERIKTQNQKQTQKHYPRIALPKNHRAQKCQKFKLKRREGVLGGENVQKIGEGYKPSSLAVGAAVGAAVGNAVDAAVGGSAS